MAANGQTNVSICMAHKDCNGNSSLSMRPPMKDPEEMRKCLTERMMLQKGNEQKLAEHTEMDVALAGESGIEAGRLLQNTAGPLEDCNSSHGCADWKCKDTHHSKQKQDSAYSRLSPFQKRLHKQRGLASVLEQFKGEVVRLSASKHSQEACLPGADETVGPPVGGWAPQGEEGLTSLNTLSPEGGDPPTTGNCRTAYRSSESTSSGGRRTEFTLVEFYNGDGSSNAGMDVGFQSCSSLSGIVHGDFCGTNTLADDGMDMHSSDMNSSGSAEEDKFEGTSHQERFHCLESTVRRNVPRDFQFVSPASKPEVFYFGN